MVRTEMSSYRISVGTPSNGVLVREGIGPLRHTEVKAPWDRRQRSDLAAANQGVQGATGGWKSQEAFFPRTFRGRAACQHPDFRLLASRAGP